MKWNRWAALGLTSIVLVTASLACSLSGLLSAGKAPPTPARGVAVSTEAAQQADDAFQQLANGGRVRLSESQFTSYLRDQIAQRQSGDVSISDLTVWFDPGRVTVSGNVRAMATAQPAVSGQITVAGNMQVENGQLRIKIDQASLGGIPVPTTLLNLISDQINASLTDVNQSGHTLKDVVIEQGYITLEVS